MIIPNNINTISELRFKTKEAFEKIKEEPLFIFHRSTPKGVLLSFERYQQLMEDLENYYLSLKAEEYEQEDKKKIKWLTHSQIKKQLDV